MVLFPVSTRVFFAYFSRGLLKPAEYPFFAPCNVVFAYFSWGLVKPVACPFVALMARAATIHSAALEPDEGDEARKDRDEADVHRGGDDLKPMSDS